MQRRVSVLALRSDIGSARQQRLQHRRRADRSRVVQERVAAIVPDRDVREFGEQQPPLLAGSYRASAWFMLRNTSTGAIAIGVGSGGGTTRSASDDTTSATTGS